MSPHDKLLENWYKMSRGHFVHCHCDAIVFLDRSLAAVRESFPSARYSTDIQNRCKSPSINSCVQETWFPYILSNQPTRLAGILMQPCLGCSQASHTRFLQKCGSNRVQGFVWCRGIGKTPPVFCHLSTLVSTLSVAHSGSTSAASRPSMGCESLAKWADLQLGSSLPWCTHSFLLHRAQLQGETPYSQEPQAVFLSQPRIAAFFFPHPFKSRLSPSLP